MKIKTTLLSSLLLLSSLFFAPNIWSVQAQEPDPLAPEIGKYHPVSVIIGGYSGEKTSMTVTLDHRITEGMKYLEIIVAGDTPSKQVNESLLEGSFEVVKPSADFDLQTDFRFQNGSDWSEYLKPLNDGRLLGCGGEVYNGQRYTGHCIEFEILKDLGSGSTTLIFDNFQVVAPSEKVPIFVETEDQIPGSGKINMESRKYLAYGYTYPELLNNLRMKNTNKGEYIISWDGLEKSIDGFEEYSVDISKRSVGSSCEMGLTIVSETVKTPYITVNLPSEENFLLRLRTKQRGMINDEIDCGTFYYLYTQDYLGSEISLVPIATYRSDYISSPSYYPPYSPSLKGDKSDPSEQEKRMQKIERQLTALSEDQQRVSDQVALQEEKMTFLERTLKRIFSLLKNFLHLDQAEVAFP